MNVSSVKNLNGETFSAVQDATLTDVVQSNSAQWADGGSGDEEVNSFVYNNSATISEVNTTYQENSGAYLTAVDLTPYQTIEDMTAYQPVSSMTSYANKFQLISVSSNLSAAIHSLDESITTGVVGDLYNYDVKGLNLYGVTSTSSYPSTGYVPSFSSNVTTHNSDGQTNVFGLETANMSQWNGKPYVSISSNGNYITGNYKCKVFYLFDGIANKSWQSQNPFSGEIGTLDKDNLIVYNNYVKPSYFTNNGISNFNTKLVFSSNDGGYHPFDVVLTFGDLGVTGTNTISGIFVPSAVDLSNYYTKSETSGANQIKNALNSVLNYTTGAVQYVQSNSSRTDFVVESYFTSAGSFLDCYETVNANSGDWSQGGGDVPEDVMVESAIGYNAVGEISAYNGSALTDVNLNNIVQTNSGAWGGSALPISAGPGIKVNLVDNTLVFSNDETVLWDGSCAFGETLTVSEAITGFERYKIYLRNTERQQQTVIERYADPSINTDSTNKVVTLECLQAGWSENTFLTFNVGNGAWDNSWTTFSYSGGYAGYFYSTAWNYLPLNSAFLPVIQKVVGINRIGGN